MKKVYTMPKMELSTFKNEDIITVSGGIVAKNFTEVEKKKGKDNSIEF